jgi:4-hydroxythreonine-4-phosphate dehydrogenase
MKNIFLAVTPGDPDGIGPEITWKAIQFGQFQKRGIHLLCVGARKPFDQLKARVIEVQTENVQKLLTSEEIVHPTLFLVPTPQSPPHSELLLEGFQSGWSIQKATELVQQGVAEALVTGPISKDRLQKGGYLYPGHTEFLADLCKKQHDTLPNNSTNSNPPEVTMMLANEQLRISLVTTHLGIQDISASLTREKIRRAVINTAEGLQKFWGIQKPKIAVTALNPHAGESGLFGREEIDIIQPEISYLNRTLLKEFEIEGPFPADTLFAKHILRSKKDRWDAVVCMYHDQGLIPVKLLDFHRTVNITLGLPIVRTSVDHGVGFDIKGKGIADASSLMAAIELAARIVKKRAKTK